MLLAAGGLVDGPDGEPLRYGKRAFLNRAFVATSGWKPPRLEPFLEPFSGGGELPQRRLGAAHPGQDFAPFRIKFPASAGERFSRIARTSLRDRFDSGIEIGGIDAFVAGFEIADKGARRFKRLCQFSQPARAQGRGIVIRNSMH